VSSPNADGRLGISLQRLGIAMTKPAPGVGRGSARPAEAVCGARPRRRCLRGPDPREGLTPDLRQQVAAVGMRHGVAPRLLSIVARLESGGNPRPVDAVGVMQRTPATAAQTA